MPERIAPRLRPDAQAMRLATDLDAVREPAGPRVEDVDFAVVAPRQPQLPAVGGHVPHVGTPAPRHGPRDDDALRDRIEDRDRPRSAAPARRRVPAAVRGIHATAVAAPGAAVGPPPRRPGPDAP